MRFVFSFIVLFVTLGCLMGALHAKHPLHNFGAIIVLWVICALITQPRRNRIRNWRQRRRLEDRYMRAYLRNNGDCY